MEINKFEKYQNISFLNPIHEKHDQYQPLIDYYNSIAMEWWQNQGSSYRIGGMMGYFLMADLADLTKKLVFFLINPCPSIGLLNFMKSIKSYEGHPTIYYHEKYGRLFGYWKLLKLLGGQETFLTMEQDVSGNITVWG